MDKKCFARILLGAASVLAIAPAFAQQAADPAEADDLIEVTGYRVADREQALVEKKQLIGVAAMMSAEEIQMSPGGNIVDVLESLPGMTGFADMGYGQAAIGEPEFLTIRGLDSSYNVYLLNGLRVPQADPATRALSLKMLAPYGLSNARALKTPGANEYGDATGGLIDVATPTAFETGDDFYKITGGLNYSQLSDDRGFDAIGTVGQLEVGKVFADETMALYASVYHDRRYATGEALEVGRGGYDYDQITPYVTDLRMSLYNYEVTRYGGNFSLDVDKGAYTGFVRGMYGYYEAYGSESQRKFTQSSSDGATVDNYFQLRDQKAVLANLQFGGDYQLADDILLSANLSYGTSEISRPNYVEGGLYHENTQRILGSEVIIDIADPSNPQFSYSSSELETLLTDPGTPRFRKVQAVDYASIADMISAKFDAKFTDQFGLDALATGVDLNRTERDLTERWMFHGNGNFSIETPEGNQGGSGNPQGPYGDELPSQTVSFMDGVMDNFLFYDRSYFEDFIAGETYQDQFTSTGVGNPGAYTEYDYNRGTVKATEDIAAVYVMGEKTISDVVDVSGGLRFEMTDFSATQWVRDELADGTDASGFGDSGNDYSFILPSLNVDYRPSEDVVVRFAARSTFTRPAFGLIAGAETLYRNDDTDVLEAISRKNPDLKPVEADNFDLSVEWYPLPSALFEVAVFHKRLENYIYDSTVTGAAPDAVTGADLVDGVEIYQPQNGLEAELTGLELHGRYQFSDLPGAASNFGVDAWAVFNDSSAENAWRDGDNEQTVLSRTPSDIYTAQLFYSGDAINAALSWQRQGRQLTYVSGSDAAFDKYLQPITQVDFSASYTVGPFSLSGQIENLTNEPVFWKTLGENGTYLGTQDGGGNGAYVETGRVGRVIASYQF